MSLNIFWFIPTHGDSRYLGTSQGARTVDADYLRQVAVAAPQVQRHTVAVDVVRAFVATHPERPEQRRMHINPSAG